MYVSLDFGYRFLDAFGNFVALILLVVVYVFLGVPLTARLCKRFKRSRCGYSRPLSTSSSMHHQRRHSMFPRRQGSEETLLEGLVDVGNDKVDGSLAFFPPRATAKAD
jgi:hypothetical protein